MPRFYFDILVNDEKSADLNGIELASAEDAHKLALEDVDILGRYRGDGTGTTYSCSRFSMKGAIFSSGFRFS